MNGKCRMMSDECRMKKRKARCRRLFFIIHHASLIILVILAGCTQHAATTQPTTRPGSVHDRQEQAMRDPFGYSAETGKADISGGGLSDFDREGFNRDLKNVLDP